MKDDLWSPQYCEDLADSRLLGSLPFLAEKRLLPGASTVAQRVDEVRCEETFDDDGEYKLLRSKTGPEARGFV